jgi:hypothetical protein
MARRPGPRPSGKTETILTRVSPETRTALEAAANAARRSLSREIEERLTDSLIRDGVDNLGPSRVSRETEELLWELRFVIERVEALTRQSWWNHGFARDAVACALDRFVRYLGPNVDYGSTPPPDTLLLSLPLSYEPHNYPAGTHEAVEFVARDCARLTVLAMVAPLPDTEWGRQAARAYLEERTPARIRKLVRFADQEESRSND